jgi:RsiW-degrading membrane proteinase PrsW (M82 family)
VSADILPAWTAIATALVSPLLLAYAALFKDLADKSYEIAMHFVAGAALAFIALLAESFVFSLSAGIIPTDYRDFIRAFVFVALVEEAVKIAQIVQLAENHDANNLRDAAAIAIAVAAGFAGAENVIYLFRYSHEITHLLIIRTLTAVPMHLATAVVTAHFLLKARRGAQYSHYIAVAVLVATCIHGLYDYLIIASRGRSVSFLFVLGFAVSWAWRIISSATARRADQ